MPQSNTASEVSSGEDEIVEIASDEVEDIGIDQKLEFRKERKVTVNDDASSDDDDDDDDEDDDDEDDDDDDNNVEEDDENEDDEDDEEEEDDDEEEDDEEEEDGEDGMGKNFGTKEERETYEKGLWMSYKDINTKMLSKYQSAVCILSHYVISVFMGLPFVKLTNKHTNRSKSRSGPSRRLGPCSSKPTKH